MRVVRAGTISYSRSGFQLLVFLAGLDERRKIGIGILPECEEILVCLARGGLVATEHRRTRDTQVRECVNWRKSLNTRAVDDLLELRSRFVRPALLQVQKTPQIEV